MSIVDYFDTPKQAAEVEQRMRQLGWRWSCYAFAGWMRVPQGFVRVNGTRRQYIRPHRPADTAVRWFTNSMGTLFDDPVSCAVALEIRG